MRLAFRVGHFCVGLFLAFGSVALAAGIASATTYTIPAGSGTLSFTENTTTSKCSAIQNGRTTYYTSYSYAYSGFSYTVAGTTTPLSGADTVTYSAGSSNPASNCENVDESVWLTSSSVNVDFLPYPSRVGGTVSAMNYPGHVNPKFIVIGVTYAPPGHSSYVSYENSTSQGTTTEIDNSFKQGYGLSVSVTGGTGSCGGGSGTISGFSAGACVTGTESTDYTMQSLSSKTISVVNKRSIKNQTTGTPNDFAPVDHDYDLIWLWLNPIVALTYNPNSTQTPLEWDGFGYDMADQPGIDKWPVLLGYLNGNFKRADGTPCYAIDSTCDAQDAQVLARSWVNQYNPQTWPSGEGPGLTLTDLANIAKADPWGGNPSYAVTLANGVVPPTTTDGRFTLVPINGGNSQSFDYKQAGPGNGTGLTQSYTNENTTTTSLKTGSAYTFTQAFGLEVKVGGTFFWASVVYDFKTTQTFEWDHSFLQTTNSITDSTDALSITGPNCPNPPPGPCNPMYVPSLPNSPSEFNVYQDNLFGSFMFWGIQ